MKKNKIIILLVFCLCLVVGCGKEKNSEPNNKTQANEIAESKEVNSEEVEEEISKPEEINNSNVSKEKIDLENVVLQDGLYVNFDKMQVIIGEVVVTIGETTLQELLDAKLPFDAEVLKKTFAELKSGGREELTIFTDDGEWSAHIVVENFTDRKISTLNAPICDFYLEGLVSHQHTKFKFAVPDDITEEQLVENSGEPDEKEEFDFSTGHIAIYKYTKPTSDPYINSEIQYSFRDGKLDSVSLSYHP